MNLYRPQEQQTPELISGLLDNEIKCQNMINDINAKLESSEEFKAEYDSQLKCKKMLQSLEHYQPTPFLSTRIMASVRAEAKVQTAKKSPFVHWLISIKRVTIGVAASVALFSVGALSYSMHSAYTNIRLAKSMPNGVYKTFGESTFDNPRDLGATHNVSFPVQPVGYEVEPEQYLIDLHSRSEAENKAETKKVKK